MNPGFWLSTLAIPGLKIATTTIQSYLVGIFLASWSRVQSCLAIFGIFRPAVSSLVILEAGDVLFGKKSGVCDTTKVARGYCPNSLLSTIARSARVSAHADWERHGTFTQLPVIMEWATERLYAEIFQDSSFSRLLSINYILFRSNPLVWRWTRKVQWNLQTIYRGTTKSVSTGKKTTKLEPRSTIEMEMSSLPLPATGWTP